MTILITSPILIGGIPQAAGATLNLSGAQEAELVNRRVAVYTTRVLSPGEGLVPAMAQRDPSTGAVSLVGAGLSSRAMGPMRAALRTICSGNSIAAQSKYSTYIGTHSILHWGNIFGGSPFRFPRITASTRADLHAVYGYSGQTLATINTDLPAQLFDPVNTAGWLPDCAVGIGLLENSITGGRSVVDMKKDFNHWRRLHEAMWPGIILVALTPLPSFSNNTAALVSAHQEMREWLLGQDDGTTLFVVDANVYENPASPATPRAGYTDASVHPNATGASMLGRRLGEAMRRVANAWGQGCKIRYNNPALVGTGAASGTNVTGTVPTSYAVTGSANGTFVVTAEQPGVLTEVSTGSTAGPTLLDLTTSNAGSITTADTQISPFAEIEIVSGADVLHAIQLEARIQDGGGNTFHYFVQHQTNHYRPDFRDGDILTFVYPPQIANSGSISACTNYFRTMPILAGGYFSYRVRKQGVLVVA